MGTLNRLFNSTESIAKEIKLDDELIQKQWKDYLSTIDPKRKVLSKLNHDKFLLTRLNELKKLLEHELVDIHGEEIKESE